MEESDVGLPQKTEDRTDSQRKPIQPIAWIDSDDVYKPSSISLRDFMASLGLQNVELDARGNLLVFVQRDIWNGIIAHVESDTSREHGGLLYGTASVDNDFPNRYFVAVTSFARPDQNRETPVSVEFTAESWIEILGHSSKLPRDSTLVGWYHSHPGLGVFMSATDKHTQRHFFKEKWQFSLVIDPFAAKQDFFVGEHSTPLESDLVPIGMQWYYASTTATLSRENESQQISYSETADNISKR
jgi:proteasome lid subunit RPN8/RPN11